LAEEGSGLAEEGSEARVIKSWANLNFWVNYAFKGIVQPQIIFVITYV